MKNISNLKPVGSDDRTREYLLPKRIVLTEGYVTNVDALLHNQSLQIHISELDTAVLKNSNDSKNAAVLLDYGQELSGGIRILSAMTENVEYPKIRIRFGESVSEAITPLGEKNSKNDHSVRDTVVTAPMMSDQEYGQTGFRFVYIELLEQEATVKLKSILAVFVYKKMKYLGNFKCNDKEINKIFNTSAYTCHLCMQNLLFDGIKRDRLIWIGDSHPEMLTIRSVFGKQKILEDSLDDICRITPLPKWMNEMPAYSMWWLCIVADWFNYTGDSSFQDKHKEYIIGLTEQILNHIDDNGNIILKQYFLDWPSYRTSAAKDGVEALAVLSLKSAKKIISLWKDKQIVEDIDAGIDKLIKYNGDGKNSKPAVALLYLAGMLNAEKASQQLTENGAEGLSTFMSYYILKSVSETAGTSSALNILKDYYGKMLEMGATTFWEDFSIDWVENASPIDRLPLKDEKDIHGDFGAYCYKGFRHSLCHGWSSGPVPFLMEKVLGISFADPGGNKIIIKPSLGSLNWAEGTYPLPNGEKLWVRCEMVDGQLKVQWRAPDFVTVIKDTESINIKYKKVN